MSISKIFSFIFNSGEKKSIDQRSAQEIQKDFAAEFNYFKRYKKEGSGTKYWNKRAFLYAFANAALQFFSYLGMALEGVNLANNYPLFANFINFIGTLISPVPLWGLTLVIFTAIVGVWAYFNFCANFKKCEEAHVKQLDFLKRLKLHLHDEVTLLRKKVIQAPETYYNTHTKPIDDPEYSIWDFICVTAGAGVGAFGWLQTIATFTGWPLLSFAPVIGGFIPPVAFAILFITLVALLTAYISQVVDVLYNHHIKKIDNYEIQFSRKHELLDMQLKEKKPDYRLTFMGRRADYSQDVVQKKPDEFNDIEEMKVAVALSEGVKITDLHLNTADNPGIESSSSPVSQIPTAVIYSKDALPLYCRKCGAPINPSEQQETYQWVDTEPAILSASPGKQAA